MRHFLSLLIISLIIIKPASTQIIQDTPASKQLTVNNSLPPLSEKDMELLKRLPEIRVPKLYKSPAAPLLPSMVDNSTQPYMRPVFSQVALECGQASGVGYNFTYEMNYRRNVPGIIAENQYPTHYVWNFSNNGASCGVSFLESWEIIRGAGTVNVADYGGMNTYGPNIWLSGYDYYYHAMKNRIDEIYAINVATEEGILTLKHWIHDHLEGAAVGGVANFGGYATSASSLPAGTPEGGKCVTINWTQNTNHQLVIVGYNDSIRYDFNGDGQYTNNIDINFDGVVDVKDWEIGGVKWVNSFGTGVGNGGYCYTMYKNLADPKVLGGIWNNTVYVVIPKPSYEPRLTYKITLTDNCRSKLKLMAGVSADTSATAPDHIMEFPVFNYQGGDFYMQGGTTNNANKTLELGLDVTPLLGFIPSGQIAKFFFMVNEKDPDNIATGQINSFALIDYTPSPVQVNCQASNTAITDNDLTVLSVKKAVSYPVVSILDTALPPAALYQTFSHQLSADGGTPPYDWEMVMDYHENLITDVFTLTGTEQLVPSSNSDGFVSKTLPFAFPFYGKTYDRVVVHVDGYLMFDDQALPWPFIIDENIYQRNTRNIAPFMNKSQVIVPGEGDGIWYEGDQNSVTIRWKTSISSYTTTTDLNYSIVLYPDGSIEFQYGSISVPYWLSWVAGISNGDLFNSHVASISSAPMVTVGTIVQLFPSGFPLGLELSKTGLLKGDVTITYNQSPIRLMVRDSRDMRDYKTLEFTSQGIEITPIIHSGNDSLIQFGESTTVGLKIKNASGVTMVNPVFHISLDDPWISLTDSLETIAVLNPGDTLTVGNCFNFSISNLVPDNHSFTAEIYTVYTSDTLGRDYEFKAYAPVLAVSNIQVIDGNNGFLDPGETSNVLITVKNSGGATATGLNGVFSTNDPYLTINSYIGYVPSLISNGSSIMVINVTASTTAPANHLSPIELQINGNNQISTNSTFYLILGFCGETFESNSFSLLDWQMSGEAPWHICDSLPYEGLYCAQSGDINDNDESILFISLNIQTPGDVSFYRRVSCEQDVNNHNYDYLAFNIDGNEMGRWDGQTGWDQKIYPVTTGSHTFKWNYHKDYSVSTGKDAGWVDMIVFPAFGDIVSVTDHDINDFGSSCRVLPNPFGDRITFFYEQSHPGKACLSIFNIQGKEISRIEDIPNHSSGDQMFEWDINQAAGAKVSPGVYFYRLNTGENVFTGKIIKK